MYIDRFQYIIYIYVYIYIYTAIVNFRCRGKIPIVMALKEPDETLGPLLQELSIDRGTPKMDGL